MSNIINVAPGGIASQSSYSQWSKSDDASRALTDDGEREFSFHTAKEKDPWWMVDLKKAYPITSISIINRRNRAFYHLARTIAVECSRDGTEWLTIHSGLYYWGEHLSFSLGGMVFARYVRLSLKETCYFHLASVEISVDMNEVEQFADSIFIAQRGDGMGERLNAILSALCCSEAFGTRFKFHWRTNHFTEDSTHSLPPVHDMFDSEFILKYHSDKLVNGVVLAGKELMEGDFIQLVQRNSIVITNQIHGLRSMTANSTLAYLNFDAPKAFRAIRFSENITDAIGQARKVNIPKSASCFHLRAGDVIYGAFRKIFYYGTKAIPLPIVKHLILLERAQGTPVYVFGQDPFSIPYLHETCNIKLVPNFDDNMENNVQKAMYELILLSRFTKIIGGTSGFARLAAVIGKAKLCAATSLLSPRKQYEICMRDLAVNEKIYPKLQTAYSYFHAYYCIRDEVNVKEKIYCVKKAIQFDPDNEMFKLILTALYIEINDIVKARELLEHILYNAENITAVIAVIEAFSAKSIQGFHMASFFKYFREAIDAIPESALLLWKIAVIDKDQQLAEHYREIIYANAPKLIPIFEAVNTS